MQIKPLTLILALVFQLISVTAFSQKRVELKTLVNKESEFVLPQTVEKITTILNTDASYYENANGERYARWLTKSGLELYTALGKNDSVDEIFFDIPDDKPVVVAGLPYGLTLNKTTLQESKTKFAKYGAKDEKLGMDSEFEGGSKLIFKKGKHYATLLFDGKNLLKSIGITKELIDPAAN